MSEITDRLTAAGLSTSAEQLANLARAFVLVSDVTESLANLFADLPTGWRYLGSPAGKRKYGQGGRRKRRKRRKRSRRNCRRYPVDLRFECYHAYYINPELLNGAWYWRPVPTGRTAGPFTSEREARDDARRTV